ncbi:unnamed protein product [Miscanthus lutarioriparius]|uniref:Uncharacterized protein n=1 Tax=Miscanthus lutarioriparius TaxID=422564 RepID=A0A811R7M5_9POAL|nr:unnamed protein product [Miscanthus lutarioriparius]
MATAMRDRSSPHHVGHFSNTSLLATSSSAGLLANFADTTGSWFHQTIALNCHAEALPSNCYANTLSPTAFRNHEHPHLESSTWPPPSSTQPPTPPRPHHATIATCNSCHRSHHAAPPQASVPQCPRPPRAMRKTPHTHWPSTHGGRTASPQCCHHLRH